MSISALRLPFTFDRDRLLEDLSRVEPDEWSAHYNQRDYQGIWRGAALRSAGGTATQLNSVAGSFADTPLLTRTPYFQAVLGAFDCPLMSVRLLALAPGAYIREHSDYALDFEDGEVRIHVPVQTNPSVEFYVSGERLLLEEGGAYYVNVNLPHRVNNRGTDERIHLVIDARVNDWVRETFGRSSSIPRIEPPERGVEAFRAWALGEPRVREELRRIADGAEFETAAVRLGRDAGFDFHEGDVHAAVRGAARPGTAGGLAYELEIREGEPWLTWADLPEGGLAEPFFAETVQAVLRKPWGGFSRRVTRLEKRTARPKGFIFHMSRCGSTLVAQLLKAAGYRVASEAQPVGQALESKPALLPAVVAAMDVDFVKFDAWSIHRLPEIRAAFPDTPWIFLHREPAEVAASHRRSPGIHVLPGAMDAASLEMAAADVTALGREAWMERVLAKIAGSAERHLDAAGLWVEYRELPDAVWGRVARHFGLELTAEQVERMREAARFDAKSPGKVWAASR